jgi:tetratricopeptide (TPR) repeat protein
MGRVGEEKGILNSLFMVKPMKVELDRCLEIDPKFPDTYYVLGLLYWKVPGWPVSIGDKKLAVQYSAQAVQLRPESFLFRWGLYEAYNAAGKKQEAQEVLQQILKQSVAPGYEKEATEYKTKAKGKLK